MNVLPVKTGRAMRVSPLSLSNKIFLTHPEFQDTVRIVFLIENPHGREHLDNEMHLWLVKNLFPQ